MGRMIRDVTVRKEVNDKLEVEIKDLSAYMNDNYDIYVSGGIWAKDNYKEDENTSLTVKGDIVDKDGHVLHVIKNWSSRICLLSGYDGFELSIVDISRFTDVDEIVGVRVYAVKNYKS